MAVFIVSDIFGVTPALKKFAERIKQEKHHVYIVDPYLGYEHKFSDEAQAYKYFTENVGLEKYSELLNTFICNKTEAAQSDKHILVGFSIGASAIWKISANDKLKGINHAFYFYGSQIRKLTHIQPNIPSTVIFPKEELHFSVEDLEQKIKPYNRVSTKRCIYLHGFMNPHSINFNEYAYTYYTDWLCDKIKN